MYQKMSILGNVGKAPEMRFTPNGKAVCNLSVAVNKKETAADGSRTTITTWFTVTLWNQTAEFAANYVKPGNVVYAEGPLEARTYTDKQGNNRVDLNVTAREFQLCSRNPREEGDQPVRQTAGQGRPAVEEEQMEDIPF